MTTSPADALVVNVAGLLGDPPGAHRDLAVDGVRIDLGADLVQASPLEVRARIARTNRGVIVSGRVRTNLADTCSRCLVALQVSLDVPVDEEVLPSIELASGLPLDTTAEPEAHRLRPPRAGPRAARPRGDPARRTDRAGLPVGVPGPVPGMRGRPQRRAP